MLRLGKWDVTASYLVGGKVLYQVYRLLDTGEVDHSGIREYAGPVFYDRGAAEGYAKYMNEVEPGGEND